jgi:hypothetical protein
MHTGDSVFIVRGVTTEARKARKKDFVAVLLSLGLFGVPSVLPW